TRGTACAARPPSRGRSYPRTRAPFRLARVPIGKLELRHDFAAVLRGARSGDDWAWRALYAEFAPALLGYLRARRADHPDDLLGEVMLQIVRDLPGFDGDKSDFRAWAFTIAHHRLLDERRLATRR